MTVSQSSNFFRYVKPVLPNIRIYIELPEKLFRVEYTDVEFDTNIAVPANGNFDVIDDAKVVMANPILHTGPRDYEVVDMNVRMKRPGLYTLRTFNDIMLFSTGIIDIRRYADPQTRSQLGLGVPFFPEIVTFPYRGYARVANDKINFSYIPKFLGEDSFSYRMVNFYGQYTEPACVNITIYDPENPPPELNPGSESPVPGNTTVPGDE